MTDKYQNKYRIKSTRLQDYDYTRAGLYFITICTQNHKHYFGKIVDRKMHLSNIGVLADIFWNEMRRHIINIELHQIVVMPNHIHGILEIIDITHDSKNDACIVTPKDDACIVSTELHPTNTHQSQNPKMTEISPKAGSLSVIISSYKSAVTKNAHRLGYKFEWQSRFYDHIIRDKNDYIRILDYIESNPQKWNEDKFHM